MDAPEIQMNLPARQQKVLDQIEQVLQAADPRLKSMFAAFARLALREAMPATEAISDGATGRTRRTRRTRRTVVISIMVIGLLSVLMLTFMATARACPGLSSDQVVASAAVRLAACNQGTNAWSRGGR
jgi:hypothetical protein